MYVSKINNTHSDIVSSMFSVGQFWMKVQFSMFSKVAFLVILNWKSEETNIDEIWNWNEIWAYFPNSISSNE